KVMLKNYLKIAFKVFLRRKFVTFISLFAISFTLVVLMVAVAMLDQMFGRMPPENKQDRTLGVYHMEMRTRDGDSTWSSPGGYKFFTRYASDLPGVEKMSLSTEPQPVISYQNGQKNEFYLKRNDGAFWEIMEYAFLEGAPFTAEDEKNAAFVAVINDATRRKLFGADAAVGRTIEVDGQRFRVVGVVANVPFLRRYSFSDVWVPISTHKTNAYRDQLLGGFIALYLARSAADFPMIREEFQARLQKIEYPDPTRYNETSAHAETYFEHMSRDLTGTRTREVSRPNRALVLLFAAMLLFLLLPTINLINLNVSRIMERAGEIGVRKAFGASSWTLVGQFIVENVLLTLIGGAIGFALSRLVLAWITDSGWFPYADFQLNGRVFLYGLATAVFFGLLSGVYPAWKMSRLHPVEALRQ
ncbi:MAG: FtsX-like permease family protein, partial [Blastocatellia bacterium]|nr:FtsX-like permease family protein [Blastocatellia bacterium]